MLSQFKLKGERFKRIKVKGLRIKDKDQRFK